jgi:hypothetical protein
MPLPSIRIDGSPAFAKALASNHESVHHDKSTIGSASFSWSFLYLPKSRLVETKLPRPAQREPTERLVKWVACRQGTRATLGGAFSRRRRRERLRTTRDGFRPRGSDDLPACAMRRVGRATHVHRGHSTGFSRKPESGRGVVRLALAVTRHLICHASSRSGSSRAARRVRNRVAQHFEGLHRASRMRPSSPPVLRDVSSGQFCADAATIRIAPSSSASAWPGNRCRIASMCERVA